MAERDAGGSTRRRILEGAAEAFEALGYGTCSVADVVAQTGLTKGAFYYYFDSKDDVATAIAETADNAFAEAFRRSISGATSAFGRVVDGCLAAAALVDHDATVRVGLRLGWVTGGHREWIEKVSTRWVRQLADGLAMAVEEGDARAGLDVERTAETVCALMIGAVVMSLDDQIDGTTTHLVAGAWLTLMPAVVTAGRHDHWTALVEAKLHEPGEGPVDGP